MIHHPHVPQINPSDLAHQNRQQRKSIWYMVPTFLTVLYTVLAIGLMSANAEDRRPQSLPELAKKLVQDFAEQKDKKEDTSQESTQASKAKNSKDVNETSDEVMEDYTPPIARPLPKLMGSALVIPIEGTIDLGLPPFIERSLQAHPEAQSIILVVDTLGGRVDAAIKIRDTLLKEQRPVIAFIYRRAISAGALISYAADYIVFSKGATMGAATPIQAQGGQAKAVGEKMVSYFRSEMRATAEAHGRDGDVAESMVDADKVVPTVSIKGKLLTLTTRDAMRIGVGNGQAESLSELTTILELDEDELIREETSWSEDLARAVTDPTVSGLLMSIGMLGIMIEFYTPGIGFAGGLGFFSLLCFFFGHRVAGLAGSEELLLIISGFALLAAEVFVIPGFGIAGILGLGLLVSGLVTSMGELPQGDYWNLGYFEEPFQIFVYSLIGTMIAAAILAKYLPRSRLGSWLVLHQDLSEDSSRTETHDLDGSALEISVEVGVRGTTQTPLRLSGKARFNGTIFDVISRDEYLETQCDVEVVEVSGSRIVVVAVSNDHYDMKQA